MKQFLSWNSQYYNSTEHCSVEFLNTEIIITSTITGNHDGIAYDVQYLIQATASWKVKRFTLDYTLNQNQHTVSAEKRNNQWYINEQLREEFKNCVDIDITLTPFTNSFPINRLQLAPDSPQLIEVLYLDILTPDIRVARQLYTKKSTALYNFQNVPNDFEADIIADTDGFVVHYPELFDRIEL